MHKVDTRVYAAAPMKKNKSISSKRIKVAVYLDPEQKASLTKLSEQTRVPWAEYVREAVNDLLEKYKKQLKAGMK